MQWYNTYHSFVVNYSYEALSVIFYLIGHFFKIIVHRMAQSNTLTRVYNNILLFTNTSTSHVDISCAKILILKFTASTAERYMKRYL